MPSSRPGAQVAPVPEALAPEDRWKSPPPAKAGAVAQLEQVAPPFLFVVEREAAPLARRGVQGVSCGRSRRAQSRADGTAVSQGCGYGLVGAAGEAYGSRQVVRRGVSSLRVELGDRMLRSRRYECGRDDVLFGLRWGNVGRDGIGRKGLVDLRPWRQYEAY